MVSKSSSIIPHIQIYGPLSMQNEVMAAWISQKTGFICQSCREKDITKAINQQNKEELLILWDCMGKEGTTIWTDLGTKFGDNNLNCKIAFFNVSSQVCSQIEKQAVQSGMSGLFLQNCSRSLLLKGIKVILKGELWFSRRVMAGVLQERMNNEPLSNGLENPLTPREKEILLCILSGASNQQISSDLHISPNTVKTHIYNTYKKINVPNRLQATLWAVKNL